MTSADLTPPSVLVVDDTGMYRLLVSEHLKRAGYRVIEAASGEVDRVVKGQEAGASDYLTKPARVRTHVRLRQLQDERPRGACRPATSAATSTTGGCQCGTSSS